MPFYTIICENSYGTSQTMKDPELFMHLRDAEDRCNVLAEADGNRTDYIVVQMDSSRLFGDRHHAQRTIDVGDKANTKVHLFSESATQDLADAAVLVTNASSVIKSVMYDD